MEEYVYHRLTIDAPTVRQLKRVKQFLRTEKAGIDFNNITPKPQGLGTTHAQWEKDNWGVSSNALDTPNEKDTRNSLHFKTVSDIGGISLLFSKMSKKFPKVKFCYEFAIAPNMDNIVHNKNLIENGKIETLIARKNWNV